MYLNPEATGILFRKAPSKRINEKKIIAHANHFLIYISVFVISTCIFLEGGVTSWEKFDPLVVHAKQQFWSFVAIESSKVHEH